MEHLNTQLTELFNAIEHSDIRQVKRLLAANVSPTQCRGDGQTALMVAAKTGNAQIIQMLCLAATNRSGPAQIFFRAETATTMPALTAFQQMNASNALDLPPASSTPQENYPSVLNGMVSPMHRSSHLPSPTFTIETIPSTTTEKTTGITPPTTAPTETITTKIAPPPTTTLPTTTSPTATPPIAPSSAPPAPLKQASPAPLNATPPNAQTLERAVHRNDLQSVNALLKAGVSFRPANWYDTPLLVTAAAKGHSRIVQALINAGANVHIGCDQLPLHAAAANGHLEVVQRLLNSGAFIHAETDGGRTALMEAAAAGHFRVVELLIARGANVNASCRGETPLMMAVQGKHREVYELLYPYVAAGGRIPFPESTSNVFHQLSF